MEKENIVIHNFVLLKNSMTNSHVKHFNNRTPFIRELIHTKEDVDSYQINTSTGYSPPYVFFPKGRFPNEVYGNNYIYSYKRILDIIFSLVVVFTVFSWLFPIIALLIKIESKGPILFKQRRTGLNEVSFECLKFRSMKIGAKEDHLPTTDLDARITQIGAFLRKYSLDELPQFINVLRGEMSVIGPRPHMVCETELFKEKLSDFHVRHMVKPGITGLAQISGYRGHVDGMSDLKNRLRYDIYYIGKSSFLLDIKIIFRTISKMFKPDVKAC